MEQEEFLQNEEINCEEFFGDICTDPENRVIDEFYEALLPIIVDQWKQEDQNFENYFVNVLEESTSDTSLKSLYFGKVEVKFKNGNSYFGTALGKRFHGEGQFFWSDGTCYKGTFQKNQMLGHGSFFYVNGARYSGQVSLGHRHGKGCYITESFTYSGSFWNSMFHGAGKMEIRSLSCQEPCSSFDGYFRCNKIFVGKLIYKSNKFAGLFNEFGERKCGKYLFENNDSYQGHWNEDLFCDYGVYKWNDPEEGVNKFLQFKPMSYTGYWLDGKRHGVGMLEFDDRMILCNWENDFKQGPGLILAANGDIFISDEMFCRDHFVKGRKICRYNDETEDLIKNLLYYFYTPGVEEDESPCRKCSPQPNDMEILRSRSEIFMEEIYKLMHLTNEYDSPLMPIFLPKYALDYNDSPILQFVKESFQISNQEKMISIEVKSVNQAVISNLEYLEEIYNKYGSFGMIHRSDISLSRLGLWQFYRDLFHSIPTINIYDAIEEADKLWHTLPRDSQNPREKVTFWQFLRHLFNIVLMLNRNDYIKYLSVKERPKIFGYFGTMFIIFLRELKTLKNNFTLEKTNFFIRNHPSSALQMFRIIKEQDEVKFTIRSVFRFFKEFSRPECKEKNLRGYLTKITDEDFIQCTQLFFPQIIKDSSLAEISFDVTLGEFLEIILRLFEMDILKRDIENWLHKEREITIPGELLDTEFNFLEVYDEYMKSVTQETVKKPRKSISERKSVSESKPVPNRKLTCVKKSINKSNVRSSETSKLKENTTVKKSTLKKKANNK